MFVPPRKRRNGRIAAAGMRGGAAAARILVPSITRFLVPIMTIFLVAAPSSCSPVVTTGLLAGVRAVLQIRKHRWSVRRPAQDPPRSRPAQPLIEHERIDDRTQGFARLLHWPCLRSATRPGPPTRRRGELPD